MQLRWIVRLFPMVLKMQNNLGFTGLMQAVVSKNYDAIDLLLKKGIDSNVLDSDGWSARGWAILMNDYESLKRLRGMGVLTHSLQNDIAGFGLLAVGCSLN